MVSWVTFIDLLTIYYCGLWVPPSVALMVVWSNPLMWTGLQNIRPLVFKMDSEGRGGIKEIRTSQLCLASWKVIGMAEQQVLCYDLFFRNICRGTRVLHSLEQNNQSVRLSVLVCNCLKWQAETFLLGSLPARCRKVSQYDSSWLALGPVSPTGRCICSETPPLPILKLCLSQNPVSAEDIYRGLEAASKNRMNVQRVDLQNSLRVSLRFTNLTLFATPMPTQWCLLHGLPLMGNEWTLTLLTLHINMYFIHFCNCCMVVMEIRSHANHIQGGLIY